MNINLFVELFVHGVPLGYSFWGKEDDETFFKSFYGQDSQDEVKYLILTRNLNGQTFCYYNYLICRNVVDKNSRPGSYFGITLRLDAYCRDFMKMYKILDTLYNIYISGHLLINSGKTLKYTINSFDTVSNTLKEIEKRAVELISSAFSKDSFTSLNGFNLSSSKYPNFNLFDLTEDKMMDVVKEYGKVALSQSYPSTKEDEIKRIYESRIKEAYNEIENIRSILSQKDKHINQLNEKVAKLGTTIRDMDYMKKIDQIIIPIKDPIINLSKAFQTIIPTEAKSTEEYKAKKTTTQNNVKSDGKIKLIKQLLPLINFILLLVIIIILSFSNNQINKQPKNKLGNDTIVPTDTAEISTTDTIKSKKQGNFVQ